MGDDSFINDFNDFSMSQPKEDHVKNANKRNARKT